MPSHAGFYVTPDDWADWMRTHTSLPLPPSPAIAKSLICEELRRLKVHKYLAVTMVAVPPSENSKYIYNLMVYRQWSEKREYIPPRADADRNGPAVLDQLMGLKVSEWRTHWYNEDSVDVPYEAEFLEPGTQEDAAERRRRKQVRKDVKKGEMKERMKDRKSEKSEKKKRTKSKKRSAADQSGESSSSLNPDGGGDANGGQTGRKN